MTGITRFALDSVRLTLLFIVVVVVGGVSQFLVFPRQEDPAIVIREVVVTARYPGMRPEEVEKLITWRLEAALRALPEIGDIWSDSKTGVAIVHAETIDDVKDLDLVWQKVRNRMLDLAPDLPVGTIGPFVNDEFGLVAVATIALWTDGFTMGEMREVARDLRDELYELDGVRKVELWGVREEQMFLEFSSAKLAQTGVRIGDIVQTLQTENVLLPGGRFRVAGQDLIIEPGGSFRSVDDIENVLVKVADDQRSVRLKDLLQIRPGYADPERDAAFFNGNRAIVISVSITPGVNAVAFGRHLKSKVADFGSRLPVGYALDFATFQPDLVQAAVDGAMANVYQTLVIVLAVVMLFLGLRTGLIVGSFVPLTMLLGLVLMRFFGIELERISIASAIIALGMLVDNGIVVAEDIGNRLEEGSDRREACLQAARTLAIPLLTSSLTTILAFVPMLLMSGQVGEYAHSLPVVVTILLLSSWFLSMYVTPFLCFWFLKVAPRPDGSVGAGRVYEIYRALLRGILRWRWGVLACTAILLVVGGGVGSRLVREMFGPSDRNQFLLYLDLPAGYSLDATTEVVGRLTDWLRDHQANPEITDTIAYVGTGGPRFVLALAPFDPDPHRAFLIVSTTPSAQMPEILHRIRDRLAESFPEAEGRVKQMWTTGAEPGWLEIRFYGADHEVLFAKAQEFTDRLRSTNGMIDVRNAGENKIRTVSVTIDQARARRANVSAKDVANSLTAHIDGFRATDFLQEDQS